MGEWKKGRGGIFSQRTPPLAPHSLVDRRLGCWWRKKGRARDTQAQSPSLSWIRGTELVEEGEAIMWRFRASPPLNVEAGVG